MRTTISTTRNSFLPSTMTTARLFGTGATVGPLVDSLHNQCLLEYHAAPINIPNFLNADSQQSLFASSWYVLPLLGFAYVVLGGVLPRVASNFLPSTSLSSTSKSTPTTKTFLRNRAFLAVSTTALIIKLSEFLETSHFFSAEQNIVCLLVAALVQWAWLDGTAAALLVASITSIGGPLSELPFVAADVWQYLPQSADYLPLLQQPWASPEWNSLALSSITGPCYFAVTMDAIALGRWFDAMQEENGETN